MRTTNRTMILAVAIAVTLLAGGCGDDTPTETGLDPDPSEGTPPADDRTSLEVAVIDVECGDEPDERLTTGQELAFDGTVTATRVESNLAADTHRTMLDDGRSDEGLGYDENEGEEDATGEPWPWTTFAVNGWYTSDFGAEISIWTGGLDLAVGDRWLIAGAAFGGPEFADHEAQSGLAVVCVSRPYTQLLADDWDSWFDGAVAPGSGEPEGEPDPDLVAQIEEARTRWHEVAPEAYTATVRAYRGVEDRDGCSPDGQVVVSVVGGVVTDAINVDRGCHLDPASPDLITIDDAFDLAITASAGADDRWLEFDPEWPFPASFGGFDRSLELEVFISGFVPGESLLMTGADTDRLEQAEQLWGEQGPDDYRFTVEWGCFCDPATTGPFEIAVSPGSEPVIQRVDGEPVNEEFAPDLPASIEDLFDLIGDRLPESHIVAAAFAADDGHPRWIYVDEVENMIDEELTLTIGMDNSGG